MTKEQMDARYKTIEGINFDLKNQKDAIAEQGEEAVIERLKVTCWNDGPPLNDAAKMKRINAVLAAAKAYIDSEEEAALEADARIKADNAANNPPKPETEAERKAREKKEREDAAKNQ